MYSLYLASQSSRRIEILKKLGLSFACIPNLLEIEELDMTQSIENAVIDLSQRKSMASEAHYQGLILGADTIVYLNGQVLGKPKDKEDAIKMLSLLSGKMHRVLSAASVWDTKTRQMHSCIDTADVFFSTLKLEDINHYIEVKKPFDKAGSYGIQDVPKSFISGVKGNIETIMGLPIHCLLQILNRYDIVGKYEANNCLDVSKFSQIG